jgi:uncharacterized circularly permuted ATP-grasp superfamily protein
MKEQAGAEPSAEPRSFMPVFDEMYMPDQSVRPAYQGLTQWLDRLPPEQLRQKSGEAEMLFCRMGITFIVYGEAGGTERLIPFDVIPRVFTADEWAKLESGSIQRVRALNMFLHDIYHEREIIRAGVVPADLILANEFYQPQMHGLTVPGGIYTHISGIDIVRTGETDFFVLEDNLRSPSGVSYMMENREVMMRLFPDLFQSQPVAPVNHYPELLLQNLRSVAPNGVEDPTVAVMTPGFYNSAYFEHAFLADQMGVELVEGRDLFVRDGVVYMRTTEGPQRVHVIYRRIDDEFMDPLAFRADSTLGVPGLMSVYRAGGVTLANAVGTGVADDKSVYPYVPDIIRFYLSEEPILENVPTYMLRREEDLKYALDHLGELVTKEVHGAGGYGMLVGPAATKAEIEAYRQRILEDPAGFISQPTLALSTCPTFVESGIAPRHVDLRPYVLAGEQYTLVPGGLTRVALKEGSLVVNSSQGGGTKDTWVLER